MMATESQKLIINYITDNTNHTNIYTNPHLKQGKLKIPVYKKSMLVIKKIIIYK